MGLQQMTVGRQGTEHFLVKLTRVILSGLQCFSLLSSYLSSNLLTALGLTKDGQSVSLSGKPNRISVPADSALFHVFSCQLHFVSALLCSAF